MMFSNRRVFSSATAALLLCCGILLQAGGTSALAQEGPDAGRQGQWWKAPEMVRRLGLTPDQVQKIDEIAFETGEQMIDLRAEREKAQLRLYRLLNADDFTEAEIDRALTRLEKVQCEIGNIETRSRIRIATILDRDQRMWLLDRMDGQNRGRNLQRQQEMRRNMRDRQAPRR